MKIKFKIFKVDYIEEETFAGYVDGYGKEHDYHPVFKDPDFCLKGNYNTKEEAIAAIEEYGSEWNEYVIQKIYVLTDS